ncbi:large ribosomal subunit protein bL32m-like isoform X1 [Apostichopus japonicus]|uniref:large ribosomal subunit protein bL32m-like isoform X1 n=1 Tax=Stichopus japonicus TaxID=307972 RepID=UPI003AB794E3
MSGIWRSQLRIFGASWRRHLETLHQKLFGFQYEEAALLDMIHNQQSLKGEQDSNPWQRTGMLWAVPKHRRTLQVRKTRRRAQERLFKRTDDLVACETCGHHRRIGFLCSNCLSRIREETYAIKASVKASWAENSKNNIQDKDNVVIYAGESPDGEDSNKNFVQMKKKRPGWFQRHLLS